MENCLQFHQLIREGDNKCIICHQFYGEDNISDLETLRHFQSVFTTVSKYLSSPVFENSFKWNYVNEGRSPVCKICYSSVDKIFKMDEMLKKLPTVIQDFATTFTIEVIDRHNKAEQLSGGEKVDNLLPGQSRTVLEYDPDFTIDIKDEDNCQEIGAKIGRSKAATSTIENVEHKISYSNDSIEMPNENTNLENCKSSQLSSTHNSTSSNTVAAEVLFRDDSFAQTSATMKSLKIVLQRLPLDLQGNVALPLDEDEHRRPKRKAAAVANVNLKKIVEHEGNFNSLSKKQCRDNDWTSENGQSDSDSENSNYSKCNTSHSRNIKAATFHYAVTLRNRQYKISKRFKCQFQLCDLEFNFSKELEYHSLKSGHTNTKNYACSKHNCSKRFFRKGDMRQHFKSHQTGSSQKCTLCTKVFKRKDLLREHQYRCHEKKNFNCDNDSCDKIFRRKLNLKQHNKLHCRKYYECKLCCRKFLWGISLRVHTSIHHSSGGKHKCHPCNKCFATKLKLKRHCSLHMKRKGRKVFPCAACKNFHFAEKVWDNCIIKHFRKRSQKGFPCGICAVVFTNTKKLDEHSFYFGHLNKKLFKCNLCNKRYYRGVDLKDHRKSHRMRNNKTQSLLECNICFKKFKTQPNLENHAEKHLRFGKYFCNICEKPFKDIKSLKKHITDHEKYKRCPSVNKNPFNCPICTSVFETEYKLRLHRRSKHKRRDKTKFPCKICGKPFASRYLLSHLKIHSTDQFNCSQCELSFNMKYKLEMHEISAHSEGWKFPCTLCNSKFKLHRNLLHHISRHHSHSASVLCDICGNKYSSKDQLRAHKKKHNGTLIPCELCDRKFYHRSNLKDHIKAVHEKGVVCKICNKAFSSTSSLKLHLLTHNGKKEFSCETCKKLYSTKHNLGLHIIRQHSEKILKCSMCEKCFSGNTALKYHVQSTHGEKKYQCEYCAYTCSLNQYLVAHILAKHKEKGFVCDICGRAFARPDVLQAHIKGVHDKAKAKEKEWSDVESE